MGIKKLAKKQLIDFIEWCADEDVVPRYPIFFDEGIASTAGCGCCSESVEIPDNIKETIKEIYDD